MRELTYKHGRMWLSIFEEDFPTVKCKICHFLLPSDRPFGDSGEGGEKQPNGSFVVSTT